MVDSNWDNVAEARSDGCRTAYGNVLSEELLADLPLSGIGRLLAVTPNDEVNSLAALHFLDLFGRSEVYQLPPAGKEVEGRKAPPSHLRGRYLFGKKASYEKLDARFNEGAVVKRTPLTEEFDYSAWRRMYGETALPLFAITESKNLRIYTSESEPSPKPGETLIALVDPVD